MKKTFLVLSFTLLVLAHGKIVAQTNVSGIISTNTTWTLAGSPYIMTGGILVSSGVTLTIEAGVTIQIGVDWDPG